MTSENIGRGPTIEVAAFIDSIRTAMEGYATWARESAAAIAGHLRGDAGPHYPAVEQFSRLHRGAHARGLLVVHLHIALVFLYCERFPPERTHSLTQILL